MAAEQKTVFDNVPKSEEGEANEEAEGAAKVGDQGEECVDEELLQHSCLDAPVSDHQPKLVEVLHRFCPDTVLEEGARVEASSCLLNIGSVLHSKLNVQIVVLLKLGQLGADWDAWDADIYLKMVLGMSMIMSMSMTKIKSLQL